MARASLYETQHQPALSRSGFYRRVGLHLEPRQGCSAGRW
jgi:hypothetical protein